MQMVSPEEMVRLKLRLEELRKSKVDVQDRITKAANLGDLSENAEYHFAKEENRSIERELVDLEKKVKSAAVVDSDSVPKGMVFLGHTIKLLDLDDDSETLVKLVGEAGPPIQGVMQVSATSPMGESLMKTRVGDKVRVRAPGGTMEFQVLEILS